MAQGTGGSVTVTTLAPPATFETTVQAVGKVLTPTGLDPDTKLSDDDAELVMRGTGRVDNSIRWLRGDITLRRLASVPDGLKAQGYEYLAKLAGVEPATLRYEASVAKAWPYLWRLDHPSMTHHALLMGTPYDMHTKQWWLEQAAELEWSVAELRNVLREDQGKRSTTVSSYMSARDWLMEQGIKFKAKDQGRTLIFEAGPSMLTVEYVTRGDGLEPEYTITEEA